MPAGGNSAAPRYRNRTNSSDIERGESIMDSGSAAALEGIRQGYLNGDPVATALFIPLFFIAGIFGLIQGKPF
jgi:hypothetical protein